MPTQDTTPIKEKILSVLQRRGPSLPAHVASEVGLSMLFASAFLSELISDRKIVISHMKVGNSPLYYIEGQEAKLENYAEHLKSKEKDAFLLLKKEKILKDEIQHPAIRVALRYIRDFAIPFKKEGEIFWRYFTEPVPDLKSIEKPKLESIKEEKPVELNIFDKESSEKEKKEIPIIKPKPKKKITSKRKSISSKKNEIFFNKVKEFLLEKSITIIEVESLSKNDLILKVRSKGKELLLFAYNKKRINELEIVKASKKAKELGLQYTLLSKGGPLKKIENLIEAIKELDSIETLK
ncbi:hypothetical protein ISS08_00795 [Candidatus Pacearchaeota archaeon]|nr:hypothetical protein [Candidatus Pacearchaeota archaeon]